MLPARRTAIAATGLLPIAAGVSRSPFLGDGLTRPGRTGACEDAADLAVLPSPIAPWKGAPLRVIVAAEKPLEGELSLIAPNGSVAAKSRQRRGGPPYFWFAEVATPAAGTWRATLARDHAPAECATITRDINVRAAAPPRIGATHGSVWPIRNSWNRATENLYSAWIEILFDSPLEAPPSWPMLHVVLRDRSRNLLFNHLGLGEDQAEFVVRPDCADLPYFLRAYFAFKMGLPFGYAKCTRGGGGEPPRCPVWWNIQKEEPRPVAPEEILSDQQAASPGGLFGVFRPPAANVASTPGARPPGAAKAVGAAAAAARTRAGIWPLPTLQRRRRRSLRVRTDARQ